MAAATTEPEHRYLSRTFVVTMGQLVDLEDDVIAEVCGIMADGKIIARIWDTDKKTNTEECFFLTGVTYEKVRS